MSSLLTAAFISASMTIEKDVVKENRIKNPTFYGFIPLDSIPRALTICLLIYFISAVQLVAKTFALALCNAESSTIMAAYLVGDTVIYFGYKTFRKDFIYWVPVKNIFGAFFVSLGARLITKLSLDFTAGFMARHPYEFGGAYFSFTMISTPVVCFYFGSRYLSYVEGEEAKEKLKNIFSSELVYGAIGGLIFLQMVSSFMFLRLIEPKYRSSFLSLKTGSQHVVETFRTATNERVKIGVMNNHRSMWKEIEEDVRVYLNQNLKKWIEEEQEWFNEGVRAMILDDLVDDPELLKVLRRPVEDEGERY